MIEDDIRDCERAKDFGAKFIELARAVYYTSREGQEGTWITAGMKAAYIELHRQGYAHSVEVWQNEQLVGGLYGIRAGNVFCGESMFSKVSNASKTALIWLCNTGTCSLIDCQVYTQHLESMGAMMISREEYIGMLHKSIA